MSILRKVRLLAAAIALGFAIGTGWVVAQAAYGLLSGDIVDHLEVGEAYPLEVSPGGFFHVTVRYRKAADCTGTWAYYARAAASPELHLLRSGAAGANPPGEYSFRHIVVIPPDFPPGQARWHEVLNMSCGPWWSSVSRSAPVPFTVLQP